MTETYKIAKEVKKITGINFLEKKRQTEYVEARSFFVHILKNYYKLRNRDIIIIFNNLGFDMDSATLCHAIKMFEVYEHNNRRMQEWFDNLFEKPNYKRKMPDETTSSSRTIPIHCETDTELIPEFAMIELNGELISPGKRWIGETSIPTITS